MSSRMDERSPGSPRKYATILSRARSTSDGGAASLARGNRWSARAGLRLVGLWKLQVSDPACAPRDRTSANRRIEECKKDRHCGPIVALTLKCARKKSFKNGQRVGTPRPAPRLTASLDRFPIAWNNSIDKDAGQNQRVGACRKRKSRATFSGHALRSRKSCA